MRDRQQIKELKIKHKGITDDKEIANALNDFFCGIGQDLAKNTTTTLTHIIST